jgi:hypothetical protein
MDDAFFHAGFLLGLLYSTRKIKPCSSETSVDFQRTKWRCLPKDRNLHPTSCLFPMVAKKRPVTLSKTSMKSSKIFGPYNEQEMWDNAEETRLLI